jgi:S1-C subfamily serine protease
MENSCKPIKVLDTDGFDTVKESSDCSAFQTGRRLYDEIEKSVVLVETGSTAWPRPPQSAKVGTGFFVNNGDEIVTNGHVGAIDPYVDIITSDGKAYHARLEKLDDKNDLALLKVVGIDRDQARALTPVTTGDLKKADELETYGRPGGSDELVLSPGTYLSRGSLLSQIPDPERFPDLARLIKESKETKDPERAKEISAYLNAERIHARMNIHHGNSGSPALNSRGGLEGVIADRVSGAHALMVPSERVVDLVSSPEDKFNFDYETDAAGNQHLLSITRKDGSSLPPIILE